jgi:hypothetical protein
MSTTRYATDPAEARALLASIRHGDKVTALFHSGGDYVERTGRAVGLLIFPHHVVINLGGRYGTPGIVNAHNIMSVKRGRV